MPYHTMYHTIPLNTMPYHAIPCHIMPYHTMYHTIHKLLYHNILYHTIHTIPSIHTIPFNTMPYHTIQYHAIPYHTIPYHIIPFNTMPYHTISYHIIPSRTIPTILYRTIPYTYTFNFFCLFLLGSGTGDASIVVLSSSLDRSFRAFSCVRDRRAYEFSQTYAKKRKRANNITDEHTKLTPITDFVACMYVCVI